MKISLSSCNRDRQMKKASVRSVLSEMKVIAEDLYQNGVTTDAEDRVIEDWIEGVKKRYPSRQRRADQTTGERS